MIVPAVNFVKIHNFKLNRALGPCSAGCRVLVLNDLDGAVS